LSKFFSNKSLIFVIDWSLKGLFTIIILHRDFYKEYFYPLSTTSYTKAYLG
jgi:hypothetical protein